jgi:predicted membrane channel-forming protein YqfA (hemolysin III family)
MAASKPIFLSTYIKTLLISLNNNFGTLTISLFWAVSLLTYNLIILCPIIQDPSLPFRVYILTDKIFTIPRCLQKKMHFIENVYDNIHLV